MSLGLGVKAAGVGVWGERAGARAGAEVDVAAAAATWAGGWGRGRGRALDWVGLLLVWELDVHECRQGLHGRRVLRVVEEVPVAGLELRVPLEDVELGTALGLGMGLGWRALRRLSLRALAVACELGLGLGVEGEGVRGGPSVRVVERHSSGRRPRVSMLLEEDGICPLLVGERDGVGARPGSHTYPDEDVGR